MPDDDIAAIVEYEGSRLSDIKRFYYKSCFLCLIDPESKKWVGFAEMNQKNEKSTPCICNVCTHPKYRRRGLGTLLINGYFYRIIRTYNNFI